MENVGLREWRNAVQDRFRAHRHSALLAALIAAFAVRPLLGGGAAGYIVFSTALLLLVLCRYLPIAAWRV